MRKIAAGAIMSAVAALAAILTGSGVRGDYQIEEPVRDLAVGLGLFSGVAAVAWAAGELGGDGADER